MKIIEPSVTLYGPVPTAPAEAIKFIEQCGRLCYKSEDKITYTSAEPFVKRLVKAGHLAMVEHSNFVVRAKNPNMFAPSVGKYLTVFKDQHYIYVGGNLTAWLNYANETRIFSKPFLQEYKELFSLPDCTTYSYSAWQVCPHEEIPTELHRYSAKFICDRGVTHELVRHRPTAMDWWSEYADLVVPVAEHKFVDLSAAQESTRYVNYGGKDMEFVEPAGFEGWSDLTQANFFQSCSISETLYNEMLGMGLKPQQARAVLPNALKTEIIVTADAAEWRHIFKLRTALDAHPDMRRVMIPLRKEFKEKYPEAFE